MIYTIRGQRVMLDKDLAALYGVEVRVLNQANDNPSRKPRTIIKGFSNSWLITHNS